MVCVGMLMSDRIQKARTSIPALGAAAMNSCAQPLYALIFSGVLIAGLYVYINSIFANHANMSALTFFGMKANAFFFPTAKILLSRILAQTLTSAVR